MIHAPLNAPFLSLSHYPFIRLRRMRANAFSRGLLQETLLLPQHLIWALFVCPGDNQKQVIPELPEVYRWSLDRLAEAAEIAIQANISSLLLFPCIPSQDKTEFAEASFDPEGLIPKAVRILKEAHPNLGIFTDVALDPYTTHGHDGIIEKNHFVNNDHTINILIQQALCHVQAGADGVAPSDMMDGRVGAIRWAFEKAGYPHTRIYSYSAKYASTFYSPFRKAIGTEQFKGHKKTYQMDPANREEALREVTQDIAEGADAIIVKPGLLSLDVIYAIKKGFQMPTLAYQVSGEYAMQAHAIKAELLPERSFLEPLICLRRAGADGIICYNAPKIVELLSEASF